MLSNRTGRMQGVLICRGPSEVSPKVNQDLQSEVKKISSFISLQSWEAQDYGD